MEGFWIDLISKNKRKKRYTGLIYIVTIPEVPALGACLSSHVACNSQESLRA